MFIDTLEYFKLHRAFFPTLKGDETGKKRLCGFDGREKYLMNTDWKQELKRNFQVVYFLLWLTLSGYILQFEDIKE